MAAEVEYSRFRVRSKDMFNASTILPGDEQPTDFFGTSLTLIIACGMNNITSTVTLLAGRRRVLEHLKATLYKDENDERGKRVRFVDGKITIEKSQALSLALVRGARRKKLDRAAIIYLTPNEDTVHDELPLETRPLVLA